MTNDKKRTSQKFCLLSRAEAAAMLGCSRQTISNWVKSGVLKGRHVGKRLYLAKESVEYIRDNASDVLAMEQKLKAMKKEQEEEIEGLVVMGTGTWVIAVIIPKYLSQ